MSTPSTTERDVKRRERYNKTGTLTPLGEKSTKGESVNAKRSMQKRLPMGIRKKDTRTRFQKMHGTGRRKRRRKYRRRKGERVVTCKDDNEWLHEVATCNADHVGPWVGAWESCRLVGTVGGLSHIVCKLDGKEIYVPQRFVRQSKKKQQKQQTSDTVVRLTEEAALDRIRSSRKKLEDVQSFRRGLLLTHFDEMEERESRGAFVSNPSESSSLLVRACHRLRRERFRHHFESDPLKTKTTMSRKRTLHTFGGPKKRYRRSVEEATMRRAHDMQRAASEAAGHIRLCHARGEDEIKRTWLTRSE